LFVCLFVCLFVFVLFGGSLALIFVGRGEHRN
jgi:hypothetical protein